MDRCNNRIVDVLLLMTTFEKTYQSIAKANPDLNIDDFGTLYTNAFWKLQYELYKDTLKKEVSKNRNLLEEIVSCLLGGYGFKAELGWKAFQRLKNKRIIRQGVKYETILAALSEPFMIDKKQVYYRFPAQKSKYIFKLLNRQDLNRIPSDNALSLRNWLLSVEGIGPKTASWITRNYTGANTVAIIDVHIYRAGLLTGFISKELNVQRDYFEIEKCFIDYCKSIDTQPSIMDLIMWQNMKYTNKIAINHIKRKE